MRKAIIITFWGLSFTHSFSQNVTEVPIIYNDDKLVSVYVDKFDVKLNDTLLYDQPMKGKPPIKYKLVLNDVKGGAKIWVFQKNRILCSGQFTESLDTLKMYIVVSDISNHMIGCLGVQEYYSPIKNGKWIYYKNGKPSYIELWRCGLLSATFKGKDMEKCPDK